MSDEYHPPFFLTGKLPKRNPDEIIWLILCLKRMKIRLPKDLHRIIYEELRIVQLMKAEILCTPTAHSGQIATTVRLDPLYDFVFIEPKSNGKIVFNDLSFHISGGKSYLICMSLLKYLFVDVECDKVSISSWSFIDRQSRLCKAYKMISVALNSEIDCVTVIYHNNTITKSHGEFVSLSKKAISKRDVELCVKHGIILPEDPFPRKAKYYIDENMQEFINITIPPSY
jgi:hypothetical protein